MRATPKSPHSSKKTPRRCAFTSGYLTSNTVAFHKESLEFWRPPPEGHQASDRNSPNSPLICPTS